MRVTDGPYMLTIQDSEGSEIPKPKDQYGEVGYKMFLNLFIYVGLDLMSSTESLDALL